jgi:phosphoglycerate dehydrogenase-like enzyme
MAMLRDPSAVDDLLQETAVTVYQVPGVYLTPHRAGGLMASVERGLTWLVDDYERVLRGEPLQHALVPAMVARLDD